MNYMIALTMYFSVTMPTPELQEPIMISANQLREMITEVLHTAPEEKLYSKAAVELLVLTAATESRMGSVFETQQIKGPALGIFQMEPSTEQDIYDNFLLFPKNMNLLLWVEGLKGGDTRLNPMKYNLAYQIAMARIHYWRVAEPLPKKSHVMKMSIYYKRYFNTPNGKGSVEKAARDYLSFVVHGQ